MFSKLRTIAKNTSKSLGKFYSTSSYCLSNHAKVSSVNTRGPISPLSFLLMALTGGGIVAYYQIQKEEKLKEINTKVTTVGKPALGGNWVLYNSKGKLVSNFDYSNQFTLLYFGFTYCPDICPSELVKIGRIMEGIKEEINIEENGKVEKKKILKPLFVSVDPSRDNLKQLNYYAQDFDKDFDYLTGTKEQIDKITRAFRVYFTKVRF